MPRIQAHTTQPVIPSRIRGRDEAENMKRLLLGYGQRRKVFLFPLLYTVSLIQQKGTGTRKWLYAKQKILLQLTVHA
jgi:hypothetical protein